MIGLMAEIRPRYNIRLEDKWFIEFCDAFSLMRGFFNRDHNIHPLLFEQFRKINKIEIENIRESSHPYIKQAVT